MHTVYRFFFKKEYRIMNYLVTLHIQDRKNNENQATAPRTFHGATDTISGSGTETRSLPVADSYLYQR
jgi:hypothetical protein